MEEVREPRFWGESKEKGWGDGPQLSRRQHRLQKENCTTLERGHISLWDPRDLQAAALPAGSNALAGAGAEPGWQAKHKQACSKKASVSRLTAHFSGLFASHGTARHEYYALSYQKSGEMEGMAD